MGKTAILSKQLAAEKHGFKTDMCISVGSGKGIVGLWVSRNVFWGTDAIRKGLVLSGRRAAAAPHERSPEKELQVQPVGPCASGDRERLSLSNFDRFDTFHIQGVSAPSYAYKILFWINTFLFFSDTSLSENVQSLRPVLVPL